MLLMINMLWVDRKNKICKSAEEWNFFPGEDGLNKKYRELKIAESQPVIAVGTYERKIPYLEYKEFGRFYCVGMGRKDTKGKGGMRKTYPNSLN